MNTPAHLIVGLAVFGKPGAPKLSAAALLGALLPDLSLYLLAGGALAAGRSPEQVFGALYYSDLWQTIFAIDNSAILWGMVFGFGFWRQRPWIWTLAGAALLHIGLDLPLHHDDGRPHFWPLSDWVFVSPISYWDRAHGALWVAPVEAMAVLALTIWLWRRHPVVPMRLLLAVLLLMQMSVGGVWALIFDG